MARNERGGERACTQCAFWLRLMLWATRHARA
jgi:hypothetical protein